MRGSRLDRLPHSSAPLLAWIGGGAVAAGAWLPWMSYFAGLVPLRGVIGLNGRLLLVAGVAGFILGIVMMWRVRPRLHRIARRATGALGFATAAVAGWLLLGVWQLTRIHQSNAMFAPRPGVGLFIALAGSGVLALAAWAPDPVESTSPARTLRTE